MPKCYLKLSGQREIDLAFNLEKYMLEAGAQALAFPIIVAAGAHSALPHASPTSKKIKPSDLLILDFGCKSSMLCPSL